MIVFKGFHPFKNGLSVMKYFCAGVQAYRAVRGDSWILPCALIIGAAKHMVGKGLTKSKLVKIYRINSAVMASAYFNHSASSLA